MNRFDRSRVWLPGGCRLVSALLLLVVWGTLGVSSAEAICVIVKDREMRPKHWDVVFLGSASFDRPAAPDVPHGPYSVYVREMRFQVLASWKGVPVGQDEVLVQVGRGDEVVNYPVGGVYVVYARSFVSENGVKMLLGPTCVEEFRWCERFENQYTRTYHRQLGRPEWFVGPDPEDRC